MNKSASEGAVGHSIIYRGILEDYHLPVYLKVHKRTLVRTVHQAESVNLPISSYHAWRKNMGSTTWADTHGKRIFRSPAYPRTASNTHQRERTKVWKHRGEEGILARLLPTPLSRATLQGTKLFGVGKFFPQESLKAMNEFPTILVIWALSGETHKWGKGEREKQIRIHKIKGHGLY